jgi:hypothetical protein
MVGDPLHRGAGVSGEVRERIIPVRTPTAAKVKVEAIPAAVPKSVCAVETGEQAGTVGSEGDAIKAGSNCAMVRSSEK